MGYPTALTIYRQRKELSDAVRTRYIFHIRFYAELLFRAGLLQARNEVLSITDQAPLEILAAEIEDKRLGEPC